ncbi:5'/3'-nucleotidase SurE [Helicobacter didelphidarum]|uniref:5'-nucleotidase SurE n=1 Tax=Helicobacter didelphidarum TaxID=2040648 RepID=A0A3D8II34_9HELI|nr:5'/3'-nucleotidase SurE [Helicobacter didelphidarum]RDU64909.1 5'/3'-nucleotidase SurE [Helicobacter didelphidarum]
MKTILITNDDGYISKGFTQLRDTLSKFARVIAVAPANEKSACGHGLCVSKPLQLIEIEKDFYKLDDGTPTDCIHIAIRELFKEKKPDLIISGINIGANLGEDTTYSGTVAGAIEGAIHGIDSIAISQFIDDKYGEDSKTINRDFSLALDYVESLTKDILNKKYHIGHRKFLNVNVPALSKEECRGVKITQLGYRIFDSNLASFLTPRNHTVYWFGVNALQWKERDNTENPFIKDNILQDIYTHDAKQPQADSEINNKGVALISDFEALNQGYISLTPMHLDLTSYADILRLYDYLADREK